MYKLLLILSIIVILVTGTLMVIGLSIVGLAGGGCKLLDYLDEVGERK